jgi:hypothetical protein
VAVAAWAAVVVYRTVDTGFACNRELLLLYICTGLPAASIGHVRRRAGDLRDRRRGRKDDIAFLREHAG